MFILKMRSIICIFVLFCLLTLQPGMAGAAGTAVGLHVEGRYIVEANGNNFLIRGINHPHTWYPAQTGSFTNIKSKGANTVRVVLSSGGYLNKFGEPIWTKNSATDVANVINLCRANRLICILEVHDTTGYGEKSGAATLEQAVSYWKEIKSVLVGQESYVIINIGNEPYGNVNPLNWVNATKSAISEMRNAGFQHLLLVDAPNWGQDTQSIMKNSAADLLASDPNHNVAFGIHMYEAFDTSAKIQSYVSSFVSANLALVIVEFAYQTLYGNPDEDAIMSIANDDAIGYLGWSWSGNSGGVEYLDMVTNFNPSQLTWWGIRIINGPDGIRETSKEATIYDCDTTGVFRPSNGLLYLKLSNATGFADLALNYGMGGDYPVVGDWDGDGDDTIGVYRNGHFLLRNSNTVGFADLNIVFGQAGDQPIAGDWDGDGDDTIGVYRPSTGQFLLRNSNTTGGADITFYLGNVGDVGIAGDWNGDGIDTTGVFRPGNGVIFLKNKNETGFAEIALNYGLAGDKPVVGDWDNNGTTTIGVYRNAKFYLRNSNTNGFANMIFGLGVPGDMPIAGDWDGTP